MSVSWSRLKAYESCRQQVLRRREGKSSFSPFQGRIFLPGTIADRCMRVFLELPDPQPGQILDSLDEMFEKYAFSDEQYVIKWKGNPLADQKKVKEDVRYILENLEPLLWDLVIPYGYEPEVRFRVPVWIPSLKGVPTPIDLIGGIDILTCTLDENGKQFEDSQFGVWDLKATRDDSYVRGAIMAQPVFYALAVRAMTKKYPVKSGFLTPGCKQKVVPVTITDDDIRVMMTRIVGFCHGVWKDEWEPKDTVDSECTFCDVKHACNLFHIEPGKKVSFLEMASRRKKKDVPEPGASSSPEEVPGAGAVDEGQGGSIG